ncbi:hypothetical protein AKJ66_01980 [candidate division MSBL1 archaeon SCGC-AAA259E22]|uniref:Uncharacterized protein n=1 Tax=candidate division MSBL1 archaeon SCGC-AAA259E22 TaxID=1698265 RepID=A0A133UH42_9EURY|nr:hypothetical protein AKJ66_01980 [candidate division MSBL1 archaeon SCGC-AAA259E22]
MAMLNLGAWEITAGAAKYSAFIIEGPGMRPVPPRTGAPRGAQRAGCGPPEEKVTPEILAEILER